MNYFFPHLFPLCVCICVHHCVYTIVSMCGGQRRACWNWLSPPLYVPGLELRWPRLVSSTFISWGILPVLQYILNNYRLDSNFVFQYIFPASSLLLSSLPSFLPWKGKQNKQTIAVNYANNGMLTTRACPGFIVSLDLKPFVYITSPSVACYRMSLPVS